MNKEIELLNKKIEAQDKIINTQALEIARLKKELKDNWLKYKVVENSKGTIIINGKRYEMVKDE